MSDHQQVTHTEALRIAGANKADEEFARLFAERAADKCGRQCPAGQEYCSCRDWALSRACNGTT